jgi:hypothetical protein
MSHLEAAGTCRAWLLSMDPSNAELLLAVMTTAVWVTALGLLLEDYKLEFRRFFLEKRMQLQSGDSSLSPRSVNWLAAAALTAALIICFVLA